VFETLGGPEIDIYSVPETCADISEEVNLAAPPYVFFDVAVGAVTASNPPLGTALTQIDAGYRNNRGNADPNIVVTNSGRVTLTSVDTSPGGMWRGTASAVDPGASGFRFEGTFAARWCGIP
jgi:hypothetical protein